MWAVAQSGGTRIWSNRSSACRFDDVASTDSIAVCVCPVAGTLDVLVIESEVRKTNGPYLRFNIQVVAFDRFVETTLDHPTLALIILGVDILWFLGVLISCFRSNERQSREYLQFWRTQHKQRIELRSQMGVKPSFWKRTWSQIRAQHKLVRVFFHKYELGDDPAKLPTGAQKITVLATLVVMKMLCLSMVWDQAPLEDASFVWARKAQIGIMIATMSLPASVLLDQVATASVEPLLVP